MQIIFLLDVVVTQGSTVLQLLASKDKLLLFLGDSFGLVLNLGLVLDLRLNIVDGIRALDFQSVCLSCDGFDKYLHASAQMENQKHGRFLLDVVVS